MIDSKLFLPFATLVLALTLFLGNSVQVLEAQDVPAGNSETTSTIIQKAEPTLCEPTIKKLAIEQLEDFRNFLETNFQNKSSTASLLDNAIGKYREIRQEMMNAYANYFPNQGSSQLITALQPGACLTIITTTLDDAKILLKNHALRTSGVKKSTALLEKYKSINNQLSDMSRQFSNLKALLDSFAQKIPCYVPQGQCVKS